MQLSIASSLIIASKREHSEKWTINKSVFDAFWTALKIGPFSMLWESKEDGGLDKMVSWIFFTNVLTLNSSENNRRFSIDFSVLSSTKSWSDENTNEAKTKEYSLMKTSFSVCAQSPLLIIFVAFSLYWSIRNGVTKELTTILPASATSLIWPFSASSKDLVSPSKPTFVLNHQSFEDSFQNFLLPFYTQLFLRSGGRPW